MDGGFGKSGGEERPRKNLQGKREEHPHQVRDPLFGLEMSGKCVRSRPTRLWPTHEATRLHSPEPREFVGPSREINGEMKKDWREAITWRR